MGSSDTTLSLSPRVSLLFLICLSLSFTVLIRTTERPRVCTYTQVISSERKEASSISGRLLISRVYILADTAWAMSSFRSFPPPHPDNYARLYVYTVGRGIQLNEPRNLEAEFKIEEGIYKLIARQSLPVC